MRKIEIEFKNEHARRIDYFLRSRFKANETVSFEHLCKTAIMLVTSEQSGKEARDAVQEMNDEKTETREQKLERMLATLLDSAYGAAVHHIGDGDGMDEKEAQELREFWEKHLTNCREEYEASKKEASK